MADKLVVSNGDVNVTTGDVKLADNGKVILGAGSDLQIYHDGSNSYVKDAGTGRLKISGDSGVDIITDGISTAATFDPSGASTLKYNNVSKLATTSTGIDVTGTVTADGLTVDGSTLRAKFNGSTYSIIDLTEGDTTDLNTSLYQQSGDFNIYTTADDGTLNNLRIKVDHATGDISFYEDTGTTAKFFWDASAESLGIGTSSPSAPLEVDGGSDIAFFDGTNVRLKIQNPSTGVLQLNSSGSGDSLSFATVDTERMRIDSSGNLLVSCVSLPSASVAGFGVYGSTGSIALSAGGTTATTTHIFFRNANGGVGSITTSGSSTAYNTSSDYRLKEDWQPMSGSIDRLKALNPVNFAWKADGSRVDGFLAHEAAEVVPEAVSGEKDAVEAIGNVTDAEGTVVQENVTEPAELAEGQTWTKTEDRPVYQGIDQAKLVPLLTAALQEAVSKIEALETRIAALEA